MACDADNPYFFKPAKPNNAMLLKEFVYPDGRRMHYGDIVSGPDGERLRIFGFRPNQLQVMCTKEGAGYSKVKYLDMCDIERIR